jgi:hypothetical protein
VRAPHCYHNFHIRHYRIRALCREPAAHDKDKNTHSTAFAVRILIERTAKGARRIFTRQRTLSCALGKCDARHSSLPCVICDARQRMVLTVVPGEMASPALYRAPPTNTHGTEKRKKRKKSKAGQGPPPPGHYHAVAGRRSSVPHASPTPATPPPPHRRGSSGSSQCRPLQERQRG